MDVKRASATLPIYGQAFLHERYYYIYNIDGRQRLIPEGLYIYNIEVVSCLLVHFVSVVLVRPGCCRILDTVDSS